MELVFVYYFLLFEFQDLEALKYTGFNPGLVVGVVVIGGLVIFLVGNYLLWQYAQRFAPVKKKKTLSKKKLLKKQMKSRQLQAAD